MALFGVRVDVAYTRPPKVDDTYFYLLEANSRNGAELLACQWAASHARVVMPVGSDSLDIEMWSYVRHDIPRYPRRGRK